MKIIEPKAEILTPTNFEPETIDAIYNKIELAGRTCYKSENNKVKEIEETIGLLQDENSDYSKLFSENVKKSKIEKLQQQLIEEKRKSSRKFVSNLIKHGHEAMIEHAFMTVRFTVDRGISHELVRHRMASFAQSSTRYCNYSQDKFGNEITVINPFYLQEKTLAYDAWYQACKQAERSYFVMLECGNTPQEARAVLPNSLKTEVVVTANFREWRNIFKLRAAGTTGKPHPQMVEVMLPLLQKCQEAMPELFGDIEVVE